MKLIRNQTMAIIKIGQQYEIRRHEGGEIVIEL